VLVAGCKLESRHQVTLQLSAANTCVRTSLACGGELGVFVADAMTNEVLETRCVSFMPDAGMALDKLPVVLQDLMPPLGALPPGRSVVVEVAAWSPPSGKSCPRFDPNAPAVANNAAVPSYYGRSSATTAGAATSIAVSLQCLPSTCINCTKVVSPKGSEPVDAGAAETKAFASTVTDAATDVAEAGTKSDAAADAKAEAASTDAKADAAVEAAPPPLGPVAKMVASLGAGQTGCLEDGTYAEDITFSKGGSSANPITLAAKPGAHPILKGILTIPDTTDNIAIVGLTLEGPAGSKLPTPLISGDRVALRGNDISNHGVDCVTLGDQKNAATAKVTTIDGNRIHGCKAGVVASLAESSTITNNTIFDNTGDGVSLFPNGDSITIEHNVIDGNGNGILFGSNGTVVSINDNARFNVISNSTGFNVYSAFPTAVGTGNNATMNCLWMGAKGDVATPMKGFSAKDNVTADPMYVDRAAKDFRLAPTSMCAGMGPLR
jgi:parallel beta-helix repeat protein